MKNPLCPVKVPHSRHSFRSSSKEEPADFPMCDGYQLSDGEDVRHQFTDLEVAALQMYYAIFFNRDMEWMGKMPDSVARAYIKMGGVIDGA